MALQTLEKHIDESAVYYFDFRRHSVIKDGDTLASAVSVTADPADLTIGTPSVSGTQISVTLSGGSVQKYLLTATGLTNTSQVIVGQGYLKVVDTLSK